ncbi:unnamed protein product [Urochloa decumbens]|uniref:Protein kinase domain-containing protein n=1 Tax=Urochloa decumbens TaxID=240449 RepID=A0ABC8ZNN0_9POAL
MAPALFLFSWLVWVALSSVLLMPTAAADGQDGEPCLPALCGNVTISFPFGIVPEGAAVQTACGRTGFQVRCRNNTPYLGYYQTEAFMKILTIFYDNPSLLIAETGNNGSPTGCRIPTANNTFSEFGPPFSISPVNTNLIFYSCTKPLPPDWGGGGGGGGLVETLCRNNTYVGIATERSDDGYGSYFLEGCNATVVPVLGRSGKTNTSNYKELITDGFLVTWQPPPSGNILLLKVFSLSPPSLPPPPPPPPPPPQRADLGWKMRHMGSGARQPAGGEGHRGAVTGVGEELRRTGDGEGSRGRSNERNIEALIASHGSLAPKRYKYSEATKITSSLNNKLGEGGYGVVYKGRLDDGCLVAVKFLHDSKGQGEEFVNEVMSIGRTSHVNIVSLYGFCLEGSKRALIYEYMPNGSLDKFIYSKNPKAVLGWENLYTIAIGIARGLEYLHHGCNTRIVHFDIKPQNILLDQNFQPKIADFGLAKLCRTKESKLSMTGARGTVGFIAPEVHSRTFGVVSTKSDVYSYGMMLLEMVGGRKNVNSVAQKSSEKYFPHWIYDHFGHDDGLQACEVSSENEGIARKMSVIGLWCIQILPMHRPAITKVLEMFERGLDELSMPPRQNFSQILEDPSYSLNAESTRTFSG